MKAFIFLCATWLGSSLCHAQSASVAPTSPSSPSFTERCEQLAASARLSVAFEDAPLTRDNTRGLDALKQISQLGPQPYHQVFGLTHAQTQTRYDLQWQTLRAPDGRVCAAPSLALKVGLKSLTVYLAQELTNPCRRAVVEEHEQEHVAVWRNHLRAGARLLEPVLRRSLMQPFYFSASDDVASALKQKVDATVGPLMQRLQEGIQASHQQIDAPLSYQAGAQRMMACP
jgi:hypothetical protein